jgi:hypothetical protein
MKQEKERENQKIKFEKLKKGDAEFQWPSPDQLQSGVIPSKRPRH